MMYYVSAAFQGLEVTPRQRIECQISGKEFHIRGIALVGPLPRDGNYDLQFWDSPKGGELVTYLTLSGKEGMHFTMRPKTEEPAQ